MEKFCLEKLLFIPAATSPHKTTPHASTAQRLRMLQAALRGEKDWENDECELRRPPPSYTIETARHLRERWPQAALFCVIGDDNIPGLTTWRQFEELRQLVTFIVLRRAETPVAHEYESVERRIDISSTEIRKRFAARLSIKYLVPPAVEEIIRADGIYQEV